MPRTTHGQSRSKKGCNTAEYSAWRGMRERCSNPNFIHYHRYGGRGIKLCSRWDLFENFYADLGPRPKGLTLDRIDNNGNYEPSNCRWASRKDQSRNTATNRWLEFKGERKTIGQWAADLGVRHNMLSRRLSRGWSVEKTLSQL